jgi:predicted RNase H-like HicB family nuclease
VGRWIGGLTSEPSLWTDTNRAANCTLAESGKMGAPLPRLEPAVQGIKKLVASVVSTDPLVVSLKKMTRFDKGITMTTGKTYTVSDGEMLLILEAAEEGGYVVTSPLDPELITEADSLDEAFRNARDAASVLNESRQKLAKQLAEAAHVS